MALLDLITVTGGEEESVRRACAQIRDSLLQLAHRAPYAQLEWEVLGPAPAPVVKVKNRYRYRVTVIGKNEKRLRDVISSFMKEFATRSENRNMNIYADCNLMD